MRTKGKRKQKTDYEGEATDTNKKTPMQTLGIQGQEGTLTSQPNPDLLLRSYDKKQSRGEELLQNHLGLTWF